MFTRYEPKSLNVYASMRGMPAIKLNLGCGSRPLDGWINIDKYPYEKNDSSRGGCRADIMMDITDLQVNDGTVAEMLAVHVVEHFTRPHMLRILRHWHAKLAPGGKLTVEMPDLDKCIDMYRNGGPVILTPLGPMNMGLTQFFGNQWDDLDYETHRYVWRIDEWCDVLVGMGFAIEERHHNAKFHLKGRDMWIVARKRGQDEQS